MGDSNTVKLSLPERIVGSSVVFKGKAYELSAALQQRQLCTRREVCIEEDRSWATNP